MALYDMVYVPVPESLYADVLSVIADRLGAQAGTVTPTSEPGASDADEWEVIPASQVKAPELDEALVRRIYAESLDTHQRLLKILASHGGEWITYAALSEEMGYHNPRQLPGTLGAFGRRAIHRYGGVWPFKPNWTGDHWEARMEPWVADVINDL